MCKNIQKIRKILENRLLKILAHIFVYCISSFRRWILLLFFEFLRFTIFTRCMFRKNKWISAIENVEGRSLFMVWNSYLLRQFLKILLVMWLFFIWKGIFHLRSDGDICFSLFIQYKTETSWFWLKYVSIREEKIKKEHMLFVPVRRDSSYSTKRKYAKTGLWMFKKISRMLDSRANK